MTRWMTAIAGLFLSTTLSAANEPGEWIELITSDFSAWEQPIGEWVDAGGAKIKADNPRILEPLPGFGVYVNGPTGKTKDIRTKQIFTDLEVHAEFMVPQKSNSGIKLAGLYEVQIFDSFGVANPDSKHCGGIYERVDRKARKKLDDGFKPLVNASKPAGEWQTMDIVFQAPRFENGKKTINGRFLKVLLNGQLVQENIELISPTGWSAIYDDVPSGPLLLQADHGSVAFRNLKVRPIKLEPTAAK